jgi:glycosyltransferase involved in cell wall biosynthesis
MKILMYGWEFPPNFTGGLGIACYGIVQGLLANAVEVALVLPHPSTNNNPEQPLALEIFSIGQQNPSSFSVNMVTSLLKPYIDNQRYQQLRLENENHEINFGHTLLAEVHRYAQLASHHAACIDHDVIHAHDWLTILAGVAARKISGKPLIFQVHALETDRCGEQANPDIFAIEQYGLQAADHVIAVSQYTKEQIVTQYGIAPEKITVVYNGIFPNAIRTSPPTIKNNTLKTVLFLGRLTYQKGVNYFVEAARKILAQRDDIQFVIAGEGDLLAGTMEYVANLRLGTHIHFTHFLNRDEVAEIYQRSDIYVMPSVSEPFGIACLEALANHIPVIVSKQSGVSEVSKSVVIVDYWDTDLLAEKILLLIDKPAFAKQLLSHVDQELAQLTWDKVTLPMIDLYHRLNNKE